MKIDLGSFAFGSIVSSGGNTPSWGTSLGQIKPALKLTYPGYDNIVIGMVYKSVPVDKVYIPLGKGGHVCNSLEDEGIQLAAMFDKVYINEVRVNAPFIMLIYKEDSDSWRGRKTLKYSTKIEYRRGDNDNVYNSDFVNAAREALQLAEDACWLISDIFIVNQDELHMIAGIVNPYHSETYPTTELRKTAFINAIKTTYGENPHFKKLYNIDDSDFLDKQCESLQQIFYGAPGTGKSHYVDDVCKKNIHYRITFHPDTDYAAFVGCYKPKSNKKNMLTGNNLNETQLLSCFFNSNDKNKYPNATKARYLYEALTHTKDIRDLGLDANSVAEKLLAKGFKGCAYTTEANCMYNIYDWLQQDGFIVDNKITYEFVPQTFLKAYIEAWKNQASGTPVYLVIEEINRGNCAQIFGDLFQLLDRDKYGFSQYEVDADTDMQEYISSVGLVLSGIKDSDGNDISAEVASGKLLKLPDNLYVWATMNTSDQSLFPIDSAFKRRWEWKYIKIKEGKDENGNKLDWKVDVKMDEAGSLLSWWAFIQKINEIIASMTSSADKQLGYFFCCAKNGVIDEETFVSKVIFYLWNDVFKDYGFEDASLFRYTDNDGKEKDLTFPDFYDEDGEMVNTERLTDFVKKVMNWKKTSEEHS